MQTIGTERTERFVNVKEFAKVLCISRRTVYRWVDEGLLPRPIKVKNLSRWLHSEVQNVVAGLQQQRKDSEGGKV